MVRVAKSVGVAAAAAGLLVALTAADRRSVLARLNPGLWEISGGPGALRQTRQCIANPIVFAQIEHRGSSCSRTVIRDLPTSAEIQYRCPGGSFGTTHLTVLTPRSVRIETQGISRGEPFNYVLQARRVGNCQTH